MFEREGFNIPLVLPMAEPTPFVKIPPVGFTKIE
jgi:hypothetical protein